MNRDELITKAQKFWDDIPNTVGWERVSVAKAMVDFALSQMPDVTTTDSIIHAINNAETRADLERQILRLKIALTDAIRSPMGVVPDSASGLLTAKELAEAETRRVNNG